MRSEDDKLTVQDTEEKILHAAEREFMLKGFSGARTTSIAEAAGVTHAMLHYYFRTKEKLFDRIISEKIDLLKTTLINSVSKDDLSLEEMIRNIIESHLDFIADNPELPRFLIGELYSRSERADSILGKIRFYAPIMITALQDKINRASEKGICRRLDAKTLMLDIASLNIFSYMAAPVVNAALEGYMANSEQFLAQRKRDNYDTIMRKLNP